MRQSTFAGERDSGMVRLYAWVMIVAVGLTVVVALVATPTTRQYSASAEVLIDPTITPSGNYIQPSMPTEQRVATSSDVVGMAASQLGVTAEHALKHLSVTVPVDTQVLVMTYTADTPEAARSGASAVAQTFLKNRNPADGKNAVASLVGAPELPSTPTATNYPVVLGVAVLAGLMIGFVAAWTWDRVRGRIRTIADAERRTALNALAVLPRPPLAGDQRLSAGRPHLDSLAARVLSHVEDGPQPSVLVSGVGPGCSSSAVAAQTAVAVARMGRVVILVTADHDVMATLTPDVGSEHEATSTVGATRLDSPGNSPSGLHLVPVGQWDDDGFAASKLANLLPELHDRVPEALVIIDGPPAWQSAGIALRADKILLVAALGRSSRAAAAAAAQALDHCSEKVMGLVITPRGGRVRVVLISLRAWAGLWGRRVMSRVAPPARSTPVPHVPPTVCDPARVVPKLNGSAPTTSRRPERIRNAGRAPRPERTRSSAS